MKRIEQIKKGNVGKWIAIEKGKVIVVNSDYHELHKVLKEKNVSDVYVIY